MKILVPVVFLFLLFAGLSSCTERDVRLSVNDRQAVDTIYLHRLDSLRPLWDTLCSANRERMIREAVDSLVRTRLAEEARLRERIKQEQ